MPYRKEFSPSKVGIRLTFQWQRLPYPELFEHDNKQTNDNSNGNYFHAIQTHCCLALDIAFEKLVLGKTAILILIEQLVPTNIICSQSSSSTSCLLLSVFRSCISSHLKETSGSNRRPARGEELTDRLPSILLCANTLKVHHELLQKVSNSRNDPFAVLRLCFYTPACLILGSLPEHHPPELHLCSPPLSSAVSVCLCVSGY